VSEALEKLMAESYWDELRALITDPEIRIREVGALNYAYLRPMGTAEGS